MAVMFSKTLQGCFRYASNIDPVASLYAKYAYQESGRDLPVVLLMHGYTSGTEHFSDLTMERLSRRGLFVCAVGMRGRDGATGKPDSSAREIHDIYDALMHVRQHFKGIASPDRAAVVGYSGGGGNALACACKFPDSFTDIVSHFGISDYGYDPITGWYQNVAMYHDAAAKAIGGSPEEVPCSYFARNHAIAISNYRGGHIYFFHDTDDPEVPLFQSQNAGAMLRSAGLMNFTEYYTTDGDAVRWLHGHPDEVETLRHTEEIWCPPVAAGVHAPWIMPPRGRVKVMGYIVTKRFSIWLGDGTNVVADVEFDTTACSYLVTPLTGPMTITINQGQSKMRRTISSKTRLICNQAVQGLLPHSLSATETASTKSGF